MVPQLARAPQLEGSTAAILRDATAPIITLHDSPWYSSTLIPGIVTTHRNWPDGMFFPPRAAFHRQRLLTHCKPTMSSGHGLMGGQGAHRPPVLATLHMRHGAHSSLGRAAARARRSGPLPPCARAAHPSPVRLAQRSLLSAARRTLCRSPERVSLASSRVSLMCYRPLSPVLLGLLGVHVQGVGPERVSISAAPSVHSRAAAGLSVRTVARVARRAGPHAPGTRSR